MREDFQRDEAVELRLAGLGREEALLRAGRERLRPILMTVGTTVLGLAPLVFERSQQALFLKPTVITLVYGLGIGSVLTLLLVPALVVVQRDITVRFRAWRRALSRRGSFQSGRMKWQV